ncbi:DedA family protein [Streptomyces griseoluteus]|uniref:DedA family protein n=1 Tax=Streptomyces griseoluteus TaxID=29306 RepID=UPI0038015176
MTTLTGLIGQVPAPAAYVILAAAVLSESVLLLGAFIPTLALLLASGALARAGDLNLILVISTAASAVVAGDALGHRTGHLLGSRLRTGRLGRRIPAAAWQRAQALMTRRGGQAVFLSRFAPSCEPSSRMWQGRPGCPTAAWLLTACSPQPCGRVLRPSPDTPRPLPSNTSSPSAGRPSQRP